MAHSTHVEPTGYALKQQRSGESYGAEYPPEVTPDVAEAVHEKVSTNAGALALKAASVN